MPKIGTKKEDADKPFTLVCACCGCTGLTKAVSRFNYLGNPAAFVYTCDNLAHWQKCSTVERDGCTPKRVYTDAIPATGDVHFLRMDGEAPNRHLGRVEDCRDYRCPNPDHSYHWKDGDEAREGDPWAPNPDGSYGGNPDHAHQWAYGDDGIGHSGDVCDCGAYQPG